MNRTLKNYTILAAFFVVIVTICAVVCISTIHWIGTSDEHSNTAKNHDWLHEKLELKDGEVPELESLEEQFSKEKKRLDEEIDAHKAKLAKQLRSKEKPDQEIVDSVRNIHLVHGKIQQLEIKHYFDMLSILPPAKRAKLRELATESLSAPPK